MKRLLFLFVVISVFYSFSIYAQELDIDMLEMCHEEEAKNLKKLNDQDCATCEKNTAPAEILGKNQNELINFVMLPSTEVKSDPKVDAAKIKHCDLVKKMALEKAEPLTLQIPDEDGNKWKLRFHFGFTRTNIRPTDMTIKSTEVNTTIKSFQFEERTSAEHYNPKVWGECWNCPFRWIDEPSNTVTISVENKKNALYFTAFHPKFLKSYYEITDGDGNRTYVPVRKEDHLSYGTDETFAAIPYGQRAIELQNTHMLMNYSLGYGRIFELFDSKKVGQATLTARVDAGVMVGAARSILITKSTGNWDQETEKMKVQGYTGAVGAKLEYKPKGPNSRVGMYAEYKYTTLGKQEYKFLDGTAETTGNDFSTIGFGLTVDIINHNRVFKKSENQTKKKEESTATGIKD